MLSFPFGEKSIEQAYANYTQMSGGYFPIGKSGFWHGGIHMKGLDAVRAICAGEVVAYRINRRYINDKIVCTRENDHQDDYSNGFVLIKHDLTTPEGRTISFFSLYMHLLPWTEYSEENKELSNLPPFFKTNRYYSWSEEKLVNSQFEYIAYPPLPAETELFWLDETQLEPGFTSPQPNYAQLDPNQHHVEDAWLNANEFHVRREKNTPMTFDKIVVLEEPHKVEGGQIIGYPGQYDEKGMIHVEVFMESIAFMTETPIDTKSDPEDHIHNLYYWMTYFTKYEENDESWKDEDGVCDIKALIRQLPPKPLSMSFLNAFGPKQPYCQRIPDIGLQITPYSDIAAAIKSSITGRVLTRAVCQFPSEWAEMTDDASKKWNRLEGFPWYYTTDEITRDIKPHIRKLVWWRELERIRPGLLPENKLRVWHAHPIAFVEHLMKLGYTLSIKVVSRVDDRVTIENALVIVNGFTIGLTDEQGKADELYCFDGDDLDIEVHYGNKDEHLKNEVFRVKITKAVFNANGCSCEFEGQASNTIEKVQDVLGQGNTALPGDKNFEDRYDLTVNTSLVDNTTGAAQPQPQTETGTEPVENITFEIKRDASFCLHLTVKMATFSLNVPYLSQRAANETISLKTYDQHTQHPHAELDETATYPGGTLCFPSCMKMLFDYWGIEKPTTGSAVADGVDTINDTTDDDSYSRNDLMQYYYDNFFDWASSVFTWPGAPCHHPCLPVDNGTNAWEYWAHVRLSSQELIDLDANSSLECPNTSTGYPSGLRGGSNDNYFDVLEEGNDPDANGVIDLLKYGEPIVVGTTASGGHIMLVRGVVVNHEKHVKWLILNDPYGTLASKDSIYGELNISNPVGAGLNENGNQANDVAAVQDTLRVLGYYNGPIHGIIANSPADLTVSAIRAFQTENESIDGVNGIVGTISSSDPSNPTTKDNINELINNRGSTSYSDQENEKNTLYQTSGEGSEKGKHVYYNSNTEGRGLNSDGTLDFKKWGQWGTILVFKRQPQRFNQLEVSDRLLKGELPDN